MKRIALFGGSFDPIHTGHVRLADFLLHALRLDELIVIPAAVSPFKTETGTAASDAERLQMCRLSLTDPRITVSDFELQKGGVSYSIETVRAFRALHPDDELYFVVGEDQLTQFHKWYMYRDILSMVTLAAVRRERTTENGALQAYLDAHPEIGARTRLLDFDPFPVSSTEIRQKAAACEDLSGLVTPETEDLIYKRGLYQPETVRAMIRDIRGRLSDYRFYHSMCVADAARRLSLRYGWDPAKAYVSGVLHDAMKELGRREALAYFDAYGVAVSESERLIKKLQHAITGADYAKRTYDPGDDIVSAIRFHTTGRENMTLPEKILFVADFISDDRDYPGVDQMRERAKTSLEWMMEEGLRFTIEDLAKENRPIHPDTVNCYNQILLEKIRKEKEA